MIRSKYANLGHKKRICLIADIHYAINYNVKIFDKIIQNIALNKPHFICVSGDILDDCEALEKIEPLTDFFKYLSFMAPVIIVPGNHDYYAPKKNKKNHSKKGIEYLKSLEQIKNIHVLDNEKIMIDKYTFTGLNMSYDYYGKKEKKEIFYKEAKDKLPQVPKNFYNVLLCHTPINIVESKDLFKEFDLVLSGHMHNGLVFNFLDRKGTRGFVSPQKGLFPKYARGLIKFDKTHLVITGGIIKLSNNAPLFLNKLNFLYPININYINV